MFSLPVPSALLQICCNLRPERSRSPQVICRLSRTFGLHKLSSVEHKITRNDIFPELTKWGLRERMSFDTLVCDGAGACAHFEPLARQTGARATVCRRRR